MRSPIYRLFKAGSPRRLFRYTVPGGLPHIDTGHLTADPLYLRWASPASHPAATYAPDDCDAPCRQLLHAACRNPGEVSWKSRLKWRVINGIPAVRPEEQPAFLQRRLRTHRDALGPSSTNSSIFMAFI